MRINLPVKQLRILNLTFTHCYFILMKTRRISQSILRIYMKQFHLPSVSLLCNPIVTKNNLQFQHDKLSIFCMQAFVFDWFDVHIILPSSSHRLTETAFLCHLTPSHTYSCICLANPSLLRRVQTRKREQSDVSEVQANEQAKRLFHSSRFCQYQNGELVKNDACFYTSESWQLTE